MKVSASCAAVMDSFCNSVSGAVGAGCWSCFCLFSNRGLNFIGQGW